MNKEVLMLRKTLRNYRSSEVVVACFVASEEAIKVVGRRERKKRFSFTVLVVFGVIMYCFVAYIMM